MTVRSASSANPLVLLLLALLGPCIAVRLRDPSSIGAPVDLLLACGIAGLLLITHGERKRRIEDA